MGARSAVDVRGEINLGNSLWVLCTVDSSRCTLCPQVKSWIETAVANALLEHPATATAINLGSVECATCDTNCGLAQPVAFDNYDVTARLRLTFLNAATRASIFTNWASLAPTAVRIGECLSSDGGWGLVSRDRADQHPTEILCISTFYVG